MEFSHVDEAVVQLEKANANLEPELLSLSSVREQLETYVRAQRLAAFGVAALARRIDDASEIARVTGSSTGRARDTIATGKVLSGSAELNSALNQGDISLDQASEIAKAEESAPGAARSSWRWRKKSPSTCSETRPARPSSRPNSTGDWLSASMELAKRAATATNSAWFTSTWSSSPMWAPRSWRAPRPRPSGSLARPGPQT